MVAKVFIVSFRIGIVSLLTVRMTLIRHGHHHATTTHRVTLLVGLALCLMSVMACEKSQKQSGQDEKPLVVVTTTMLASAAEHIGADVVQVQSIMRPGGDPHLYQPTPSDAKKVARSQLVITSGLHLEGWLDSLVEHAGGERPIQVASEGIEPIRMEGAPGGVDPHFWFDLDAWQTSSEHMTTAMIGVLGEGSEEARRVRERGDAYKARIARLDGWVKTQLATIPEAQRVLITSHDAFNYFGRRYGIEVIGIQGASTEQEASQRDMVNVIELVKSRKIPTIFIESSVNPALIKQVAKQTGVKTAGPLYSDSIGMPDSDAPDFERMIIANTTQIVEGLGGEVSPFDS